MSIAAIYNFEVWRGTTPKFVFRLKTSDGADPPVLTPMTWADVSLTFEPKNGVKVTHKLTDLNASFFVTDAPNAEITWSISIAESRSFPVGERTTYEVQVKDPNGSTNMQMVYLAGTINALGGINDD